MWTRRELIAASGTGALWLASGGRSFAQTDSQRFRHGVASGDPTAEAVILWTRVEPASPAETVRVEWVVARDRSLRDVVRTAIDQGDFTTGRRDAPD